METTTFVGLEPLEVRDVGEWHELEGICVPYGIPSYKAIASGPELFRDGAFATATTAADKVRLKDWNHAPARPSVGVARVLEERSAGLWGRFRFYGTKTAGEAFENVREGVYRGLSVGFTSIREQQVAGRREILEARLHHVSLVEEPAYEDAKVLQLRGALVELEHLRRPPVNIEVDEDDTPMLVRVRRMLGNVRD
jgi:HK97 family phage prohead protease